MRLYKRGEIWWCSYYEGTARKQSSTRCSDKKAAEAVARKLEQRASDPHAAAVHEYTLEAALNALIARTKNAATRGFYKQKAGHWLGILGADFPLGELLPNHIDQFISTRRDHEVTESTIHKELATLKAALNLAIRARLFTGQIKALFPSHSPEYKPRERWLEPHEISALVSSYDVGRADQAARIAFAIATGAEWAALERAQRSDVNEKQTMVRVRGTKSALRDRSVPIVTQWQKELLAFAMKHAQGDKLLFRPWLQFSALNSLKYACVRANIAKCTWHDLRRTCAQLLRRGGTSFDTLAPFLGHSTTAVTQKVYARLDPKGLSAAMASEMGLADCNAGVTASVETGRSNGKIGKNPTQKTPRKPGKVVGYDRLELSANGLRVRCSTN